MLRNAALTTVATVLASLLVATSVQAQSAIAGTVRDPSGAVLPGVTIEAASPALIEKVRTTVTDSAGQYRIVDLRPGVYTVTFSLTGFTTVKREAVELPANFTAPVNADLRIGGLEESVTVSGASPVVDVQSTQRRETLSRETLDALPTARSYQTIGQTLPALTSGAGRFDVGGSSSMWQSQLAAFGGRTGDQAINVDGLSMNTAFAAGQTVSFYHNDGAYQEMVYQVSSGGADTQTPGVSINMIPREGGNRFSANVVTIFANEALQGTNFSDELRTRGLTAPARLDRTWDANAGVGGPIVRDRLWFFGSVRNWAYNNRVAGVFLPNGEQAVDDNLVEAYTGRITLQVTPRNKLTAGYENNPRWRGHRDIETGTVAPEATGLNENDNAFFTQAKWTSTISSKLLYEVGFSYLHFNYWIGYRPEVRVATCTVAFASCPAGTDYGDISHVEITNNYRSVAPLRNFNDYFPKTNIVSAVSYVSGAHALKGGIQWGWGKLESWRETNGDIIQRYRNGVPNQVQIKNTPTFAVTNLKADVGVFLQDSWTIRRLTLSPGLRFEWFNSEVPAQSVPAGRFVPAREFDAIRDLPNWKNWAPRLGVAFDVFGDARTAIKGSAGKYLQQESTGFATTYNPVVESMDTRNWTDVNGDDIAQEGEIGPGNASFGTRRNRNADPNIDRPYQLVYNATVQRELRPGVSATFSYNRRTFHDTVYTVNLAAPVSEYTLISVADPRGNGQTLPVYNINPAVFGRVDELDTNSNNETVYNGFDLSLAGRLRGGSFTAGTSTGRARSVSCEVGDPNSRRFCDETRLDIPWRTTFKVSGSYPLPYGLRVGAVFQSVAGAERALIYPVDRTILPALVQTSVNVRLNEPGSLFEDRVHQLDLNIGKTIRLARMRVSPQVELFNIFNANPVTTQVNTFGSSLNRPLTVLAPRLVRLGLQVNF
jgi:hypothetical protein